MEIVAISMDEIGDARQMAVLVNAPFPVLADTEGRTAREYEVYDLLGDGVAAPAVFIVGKDQEIQWKQIGGDIADRPDAAELLRQLDDTGS